MANYFPPQSAPPSRILHVYTDGEGVKVFDTDKTTPFYVILTQSFKPHMRFYRPSTPSSAFESQIGSASFHSFSRAVDLEIRAAVVLLKPKGHFTRSMEFRSSVGLLTWHYDSSLSDTVQLLGPQGNWLARFESAGFSCSKLGKLEIAGSVYWGPGLLDEIVISGLVIVQTNLKTASTAAESAGAF